MCSRHVSPGGGPGDGRGHARGTMSLGWPGNALGSPRRSWRRCLERGGFWLSLPTLLPPRPGNNNGGRISKIKRFFKSKFGRALFEPNYIYHLRGSNNNRVRNRENEKKKIALSKERENENNSYILLCYVFRRRTYHLSRQ
ncbi:hypothetical protein XENORESO_016550 [Xenotaenia resolanae]|uniref:Uncharacterized protein n=1 Tax=Xenotaenia resolanae TaxID=208358 RepID=A0ABV0VYP2_9TELE